MKTKKKLSSWYLITLFMLSILTTLVFLVMSKIDQRITKLEDYIIKRNLGYIVKDSYTIDKEKQVVENIPFLNQLTDFYTYFHEQQVQLKNELEIFHQKRNDVLKRFSQSSVDVYNISLKNPKKYKHTFKPRKINKDDHDPNQINKNYRQLPFTKVIRLKSDFNDKLSQNIFLLCSARIQIVTNESLNIKLAFFTDIDYFDPNNFTEFTINEKSQIITLNKILRIRDAESSNVMIKGISNTAFQVQKVDSNCLNFNDVRQNGGNRKSKFQLN